MIRQLQGFLLPLVLFGILSGCEKLPSPPIKTTYLDKPANSSAVYRFAVHPLYNPQTLFKAYQPLIDRLNAEADGWRFQLEASDDYQDYERKFGARAPEVLLPNPWHTIQAQKKGYSVIAQAGDPSDFRGIFLVRRESRIRLFDDLRGKTVSYPSYTALAACILPQYFLHEHGVNVRTDIKNTFVGSQESSIMNVVLGTSDVGVTWPPPWRLFQAEYPDKAKELRVIWETKPMINNSVMVRDDLPQEVVVQLRKSLTELDKTPDGLKVLAAMSTKAFLEAGDQDYAVVDHFIKRFEREVRPVSSPN